nr:BBX transcription factor [Toona sinensis]
MKIQCDVCERAPATVICCADEAALCAKCDVEVHAANKLASKHQRLLLQCLSSKLPPCDICQVISPLSELFYLHYFVIYIYILHRYKLYFSPILMCPILM